MKLSSVKTSLPWDQRKHTVKLLSPSYTHTHARLVGLSLSLSLTHTHTHTHREYSEFTGTIVFKRHVTSSLYVSMYKH